MIDRHCAMGDECTIWVGGLPEAISEDKIRDEYDRYGKIKLVRIHEGKGGGTSFAFIQYEERRDAVEAIERTDQQKLFGMPFVKVSWSGRGAQSKGKGKGKRSRSRSRRRSRSDRRSRSRRQSCSARRSRSARRSPEKRRSPTPQRSGSTNDRDRSPRRLPPPPSPPRKRSRSRSRRPPPRSSDVQQGKYRVQVERLPEDMGWQELKETGSTFARRGQCSFARTNRDRTGILEYTDIDDMRKAIDELNGRRFAGARDRMIAYEEGRRRD